MTTGQPDTYRALEARFVEWALGQVGIRAAVVVGSRARGTADAWSDLDLVLFVADPAAYSTEQAWLSALGQVVLAVLGRTGRGDPEWLVVYAGGLKADFVLAPAAPGLDLAGQMAASRYGNVYRRGVRPLLDKAAPPDVLPAVADLGALPAPQPPSPAEFEAALAEAWLGALRADRLLRRGDLWRARQAIDCGLKHRLLQLLAWQAEAARGPAAETWDDGRDLAQWADPAALAALPAAFGAYTLADQRRALRATFGLIQQLARECAAAWGYSYPADTEARLEAWLADEA